MRDESAGQSCPGWVGTYPTVGSRTPSNNTDGIWSGRSDYLSARHIAAPPRLIPTFYVDKPRSGTFVMKPDQLFLYTLADLEQREAQLGNEYELLMAAGLLRKLFLDGQPLIDAVNHERKLSIRFEVTDRTAPSAPAAFGMEFWAVMDGFDPATSRPGVGSIQVNRDQFLRRVILYCDGNDITVHDVIDYLAHVGGAVHAGPMKAEKQRAIARITEGLTLGGDPGVLRSVRAVIRVVIKGLDPLRQAIRNTQAP